MTMDGPVSRRLRNVAQSRVEGRIAEQITKKVHEELPTMGPLLMDDAFVKDGLHAVLTMMLGEQTTSTPGSKELKDAARSFVDPRLTAAERRAKLAQAAGDPLTDATLAVLQDIASLIPAGALSKGGAALGKAMGEHDVKASVGETWFATFLPSGDGVQQLGAALENVRSKMQEPEFRAQLSRALDVVRALGRLEAKNLERIGLDLGPDKSPALKQALKEMTTSTIEAMIDALIPADSQSGRIAKELVALGALKMKVTQGTATVEDAARFKDAIARLSGAESLPDAREALHATASAAKALPDRLDAAHAKLISDLKNAGVVDDASAEGINEIAKDISAVAVTAAHLLRLIGAARNGNIPDDERITLLKDAAKDAGPVVVKLLQTFANQSSDNGMVDDVTLRGLRELQENAPPMSEAEVRAQIEAGLGLKLEDAFVSFDMKPIASASIGQVHRARIKPRFGEEREVVVKVQRPGLDVEFARATRVARLGLQLATEMVSLLTETRPGEKPLFEVPDKIDPKKIMRLIEETVTAFVSSFEIETDFDKERVNLKAFRRDMSTHGYVTAPYVFRRWSSRTVLTMEYMKLEKLPSLQARADVARAQKRIPAPVGALDTKAPVDDVKTRALDHLPRAFGVKALDEQVEIERDGEGYVAAVKSDHPMFETVVLRIEDNGVIKHVKTPPIIKDADVKLVRDRLLASVLSQAVIHGRVHGDPHKGNWGILADGKTLVFLDFGKTIHLEKRHLMAPLSVAWAYWRRDADGMASAIMNMTSAQKGKDLKEARKKLTEALAEIVKKDTDRPPPEDIAATVLATIAQLGLGLSDVYSQGIKVAFSFAGNFTGLADAGAGDMDLETWMRAGKTATGDALDSATLGVVGGVLALRKNARVKKLNA